MIITHSCKKCRTGAMERHEIEKGLNTAYEWVCINCSHTITDEEMKEIIKGNKKEL